jgi:hypothetical protein
LSEQFFCATKIYVEPRLPDGIFSNQESQFWSILKGLAMEDAGIFYSHLVYFTAIWYILWLFGISFPFWYVVPRQIWQPCLFNTQIGTHNSNAN